MWVAIGATWCYGPVLGAVMASIMGGSEFAGFGFIFGWIAGVCCSPVVGLAFYRKQACPSLAVPFAVTFVAGLISLLWQDLRVTLSSTVITLCVASWGMRPFASNVSSQHPIRH